MDYPLQLSAQLRQILKSLRKSRGLTQEGLAQRLGLVQSRVADIEAHPGAVSVEQLLQVLTVLGAQWVVRDAAVPSTTSARDDEAASAFEPDTKTDAEAATEPKGQW